MYKMGIIIHINMLSLYKMTIDGLCNNSDMLLIFFFF